MRKVIREPVGKNLKRVFYIRNPKHRNTYILVDIWDELYENGKLIKRFKRGSNLAYGRRFINVLYFFLRGLEDV